MFWDCWGQVRRSLVDSSWVSGDSHSWSPVPSYIEIQAAPWREMEVPSPQAQMSTVLTAGTTPSSEKESSWSLQPKSDHLCQCCVRRQAGLVPVLCADRPALHQCYVCRQACLAKPCQNSRLVIQIVMLSFRGVCYIRKIARTSLKKKKEKKILQPRHLVPNLPIWFKCPGLEKVCGSNVLELGTTE